MHMRNDEAEALEFVAGRKGTSEFPRRRYPQAACSDLGPLFAFVLNGIQTIGEAFLQGGRVIARCSPHVHPISSTNGLFSGVSNEWTVWING